MSKSPKNQEVQIETSNEPTLEQRVATIASDQSKNVSVRIRELAGLGLKMGPITKALTTAGYKTKNGTDIRFQHVRNVLKTEVKKSA